MFVTGVRRPELQVQDESQPVLDILQQLATKATGGVGQEVAIHGDDLRDVGYGISGQPSGPGWYQHVARSFNQAQVGSQDDRQNGTQATAIESIALDNQNQPPESRLRARRLAQVGPPDLASLNYHASRSSDRRCVRRTRGSRRLSSVPYTALS